MPPRTPIGFLLLVLVSLAFLSAVGPVGADSPTVIDNGDASRTVRWEFTNRTGLTFQDVELDGNRLVLPWRGENLTWGSPGDFLPNGTLDANLIAGPAGLELASDPANRVLNGDFASDTYWAFADGASGTVTARRIPTSEIAALGHNSVSTESQWDSMDDALSNWGWVYPAGTLGGIVQNLTGQREGLGRLGMNINTQSGTTWGSVNYTGGPVDWSSVDRFLVWVDAIDIDPPITVNITARVAEALRSTPAHTLVPGWQEVVIDITSLGTPAERYALREVHLRVNVVNAPYTWVYFDDARLASIKQVDETASLTQLLQKPNETASRPGSGILEFDWTLANATGIAEAEATANLSGSSGSFEASFGGAPDGWQRFRADVSSTSAPAGEYVLLFRFRVAMDNTSESHANLLVDNVSLRFPDRGNGTFVSGPISLGTASDFLNASWSAILDPETSARVSLRSGNGTDTSGPSWTPWAAWTAPDLYALSFPGADHLQVRIDLNTTNASRSPVIRFLSVETRHRTLAGTAASSPFSAAPGFLDWTLFAGNWTGPPGTSVSFEIGNGSFWTAVPISGDVSALLDSVLLWRATLSTTDGLATPHLWDVQAVYEFRGPVDRVRVTAASLRVPQNEWLQFAAVVLDAGDHTLTVPVVWTTDDREGEIRSDGSYRSGRVGLHNVTATAAGSSISDSITVEVVPGGWLAADFPYPAAVAAVLGAAVVVYQLLIRRMFSVDDVFLISKDGRLMMHNTRRMRADRDEDILSGMLTAIRSFVRDADPEEDGELRRFELGGKTTLLERGKDVFVSAVYSGRVPRWAAKDLRHFVADLEARFGKAFANWNGAREDLPDLKEATRRFVSRVRYRSPRNSHARPNGLARGTRDRT